MKEKENILEKSYTTIKKDNVIKTYIKKTNYMVEKCYIT